MDGLLWLLLGKAVDTRRYYGRKEKHPSAEFAYNHIICPPMVLWLGEASGVPKREILNAGFLDLMLALGWLAAVAMATVSRCGLRRTRLKLPATCYRLPFGLCYRLATDSLQ